MNSQIYYRDWRLPEKIPQGAITPHHSEPQQSREQRREELVQSILQQCPTMLKVLMVWDDYIVNEIVSFFENLWTGEHDARELLKEFDKTFDLFKSKSTIIVRESSKESKVSVDMYLKDFSDPRFQWQIDHLLASGCVPENVNLEIRFDNHGNVWWEVIKNIQYLRSKGFTFSVCDIGFTQENTIDVRSLYDIFISKTFPIFIKVSKKILDILRDRNRDPSIQISPKIQYILWVVKTRWIKLVAVE